MKMRALEDFNEQNIILEGEITSLMDKNKEQNSEYQELRRIKN
jgi:hypothetical protein